MTPFPASRVANIGASLSTINSVLPDLGSSAGKGRVKKSIRSASVSRCPTTLDDDEDEAGPDDDKEAVAAT